MISAAREQIAAGRVASTADLVEKEIKYLQSELGNLGGKSAMLGGFILGGALMVQGHTHKGNPWFFHGALRPTHPGIREAPLREMNQFGSDDDFWVAPGQGITRNPQSKDRFTTNQMQAWYMLNGTFLQGTVFAGDTCEEERQVLTGQLVPGYDPGCSWECGSVGPMQMLATTPRADPGKGDGGRDGPTGDAGPDKLRRGGARCGQNPLPVWATYDGATCGSGGTLRFFSQPDGALNRADTFGGAQRCSKASAIIGNATVPALQPGAWLLPPACLNGAFGCKPYSLTENMSPDGGHCQDVPVMTAPSMQTVDAYKGHRSYRLWCTEVDVNGAKVPPQIWGVGFAGPQCTHSAVLGYCPQYFQDQQIPRCSTRCTLKSDSQRDDPVKRRLAEAAARGGGGGAASASNPFVGGGGGLHASGRRLAEALDAAPPNKCLQYNETGCNADKDCYYLAMMQPMPIAAPVNRTTASQPSADEQCTPGQLPAWATYTNEGDRCGTAGTLELFSDGYCNAYSSMLNVTISAHQANGGTHCIKATGAIKAAAPGMTAQPLSYAAKCFTKGGWLWNEPSGLKWPRGMGEFGIQSGVAQSEAVYTVIVGCAFMFCLVCVFKSSLLKTRGPRRLLLATPKEMKDVLIQIRMERRRCIQFFFLGTWFWLISSAVHAYAYLEAPQCLAMTVVVLVGMWELYSMEQRMRMAFKASPIFTSRFFGTYYDPYSEPMMCDLMSDANLARDLATN